MVNNIKEKSWFRRHPIWTGIIILLLLGFVGSMFSDDAGYEDTNSETEELKTFQVEESFIVDDVEFTINKVTKESIIGDYVLDILFGTEANGIFYVVDLTLENKAKESKNIFVEQFKIVDNQERKFDYDTEAEIYYKEGNKKAITFGEQLQPDLPVTGVKIFDIPPIAEDLKLEIRCCGLSSEVAYVDLIV